ncbi:hypothetical protein KUCAC02_034745 [Chaenocephalus aceratus]|nr:hypothetical protein KUCAC02_034745 [Chaenocephalus aceratus]
MVLGEVPVEYIARPLGRNEVLGLIFRLTIFGAVTYFTIKWMVDAIDPTRKQKLEAQKQIGVKNVKLSEYEMSIAAHLVDPLSMQITLEGHSWSGRGVITELKETVILPVQKRHLFLGSRLLQPPKGVLLYGPPGCGKTLIAKATAKEAEFRFINLQPSTLTDKWYGESQKLAAAVFSLAVKLQPAIIFVDEIDSFLRSRSSSDHEATAMMKAQFMSLWDGLDTDTHCQVIIMGATNRPQDLDSAILRRMPTRFHINQPSNQQREQILKLILEDESVDLSVDLCGVAKETEGFSGSDLREMCRDAALLCVRDFVHQPADRTLPTFTPVSPVRTLHTCVPPVRTLPTFTPVSPVRTLPTFTPVSPVRTLPTFTPVSPVRTLHTCVPPVRTLPTFTPVSPVRTLPTFTPVSPVRTLPTFTPVSPVRTLPTFTPVSPPVRTLPTFTPVSPVRTLPTFTPVSPVRTLPTFTPVSPVRTLPTFTPVSPVRTLPTFTPVSPVRTLPTFTPVSPC